MRSGVYVPLTREDVERIVQLAERERRDVRQQARYLLEKALNESATHLGCDDGKPHSGRRPIPRSGEHGAA